MYQFSGKELPGTRLMMESGMFLPGKQIREAPGATNPGALAVRFEVESWQKRINPIKPGQYGPRGPQRTSWELFKEAQIYPELHFTGVEVRFWRELRRFKECMGLTFPGEQISELDQMVSMEFPGLVIRKMGRDLFTVTAGNQSKQYRFSELNSRPGKVLREIIFFWRSNS